MIKVTFENEDQLKKAISDKFTICHRRYPIELFKHKPRVIKCNLCQTFGHVDLQCRKKTKPGFQPICGKCSQEGHQTNDCTVDDDEIRCYHCELDHITGSYSCEKVKEMLQAINERQNGP